MDAYEKKYKEALSWMQGLYDGLHGKTKEEAETCFPELKELKDEKIRKGLIEYFDRLTSKKDRCIDPDCELKISDIIAWLEKHRYSEFELENEYWRGYDAKTQGEQKPVFEMKTPEESLGVDSDTYNKIVDECIYGEQKPAWSEEDDNCLSTIIAEFSKCAGKSVSKDEWMRCNDFLYSLRDRVQPKQEWSEEDEAKFEKS